MVGGAASGQRGAVLREGGISFEFLVGDARLGGYMVGD
jgi:hypothetical protein